LIEAPAFSARACLSGRGSKGHRFKQTNARAPHAGRARKIAGVYIQSLRVERAVDFLKTSRASVDEVAARDGNTESSILRVLLLRRPGLGIKEIRRSA
jgi:transcriptional regulator GlxA family with amidase domain